VMMRSLSLRMATGVLMFASGVFIAPDAAQAAGRRGTHGVRSVIASFL